MEGYDTPSCGAYIVVLTVHCEHAREHLARPGTGSIEASSHHGPQNIVFNFKFLVQLRGHNVRTAVHSFGRTILITQF